MKTDAPTVEFIYERTCPFVREARRRLIEGFRAAGQTPRWSEWEVSDPNAPDHVRDLGSPTILVDGRDIAGAAPDEAQNCCRIYTFEEGQRGIPPLNMVAAALSSIRGDAPNAEPGNLRSRIRSHTALLPAIGLAALPKLTCPACWPAYAGVMSSLGVGFVNYTPYLMPLTALFLSISVLALAYRAPQRRGYGPLLLGTVAAAAALIGKFGYDSDATMWIGLGALVIASVWNTWPLRRRDGEAAGESCGTCADDGRAPA